MVVFFTFRQLGQEELSTASLWNTPIAVRSNIIHQVHGGWSGMLAVFLRRILLGPSGLATAGITLELPCGPRLLFGRLGNLLTDGDGFRSTLQMEELQQQSDKKA